MVKNNNKKTLYKTKNSVETFAPLGKAPCHITTMFNSSKSTSEENTMICIPTRKQQNGVAGSLHMAATTSPFSEVEVTALSPRGMESLHTKNVLLKLCQL